MDGRNLRNQLKLWQTVSRSNINCNRKFHPSAFDSFIDPHCTAHAQPTKLAQKGAKWRLSIESSEFHATMDMCMSCTSPLAILTQNISNSNPLWPYWPNTFHPSIHPISFSWSRKTYHQRNSAERASWEGPHLELQDLQIPRGMWSKLHHPISQWQTVCHGRSKKWERKNGQKRKITERIKRCQASEEVLNVAKRRKKESILKCRR